MNSVINLSVINSYRKAKSDKAKAKILAGIGFDAAEIAMMLKGRNHEKAIEEMGGVWYICEVPFCQAISKSHAEKLGHMAFSDVPEAVFRRK